ncbi:MAG: AAA family ATPase [Bacteroidales bacterium]|nr:AAA family ATPase [Bacteroidales bacterium]
MYKRKIENMLLSWLETPAHKPLVVKGVRQCGKTSSVIDFAHKHFKNVVYLDFRADSYDYSTSRTSRTERPSPR